MARVAQELGVGTMSLYRYVAAKDELLTLMVDAALGAPARPGQHRRGLARRPDAVGGRSARRLPPSPLVAEDPDQRAAARSNNVAWLEAALERSRDTPLSSRRSSQSCCWSAASSATKRRSPPTSRRAAAGEQVMPGYGSRPVAAYRRADFPALHRAIASGALDDEDDHRPRVQFGLERILDGIEIADRPHTVRS